MLLLFSLLLLSPTQQITGCPRALSPVPSPFSGGEGRQESRRVGSDGASLTAMGHSIKKTVRESTGVKAPRNVLPMGFPVAMKEQRKKKKIRKKKASPAPTQATTAERTTGRRKKRSRPNPEEEENEEEEELASWTCQACGFAQRPTRRAVEEHAQCAQCSCVRGDILHRERSAGVEHLLMDRPLQTAYSFRYAFASFGKQRRPLAPPRV